MGNLSYEEKYEIMKEYIKAYGKIKSRDEYKGYPIGQWQSKMRNKYYNGELFLDENLEEEFLKKEF